LGQRGRPAAVPQRACHASYGTTCSACWAKGQRLVAFPARVLLLEKCRGPHSCPSGPNQPSRR
jgi:hypothetical protein